MLRTESPLAVISQNPPVLVLTHDGALVELLTAAFGRNRIEARFDARSAREALAASNVRLVVVDDGALVESERGWFLDQARRRAPNAFVIYVASNHAPEVERRARTHGVLYYTSRPLETERLGRLLTGLSRSLPRGNGGISGTN
jgi:DNA-binding NtrC family response regulator